MTLLAAATMMTVASAQQTERIGREEMLTLYGDAAKTDSLYDFWNTYVQVHPKDEVAWRNLFDVSEKKVYRRINTTKDWKGSEEYRKQLNVVGTDEYIMSSAVRNYSYVQKDAIRFEFTNPEVLYAYSEEELRILMDEMSD